MMHDQYFENPGRRPVKVVVDRSPHLASDAASLDCPTVRRVDSQHRQPVLYERRCKIGRHISTISLQRIENPRYRPPPRIYIVVAGHNEHRCLDRIDHLGCGLILVRSGALGEVTADCHQRRPASIQFSNQRIHNEWMDNIAEVSIRQMYYDHGSNELTVSYKCKSPEL